MFFSLAALVASAAAVSAQTNHQIIVGGTAGKVFTPNSITAAVGDTVTFEFQATNHTVTQSAFADPCALLTNTTTNQVGFDSDFVPVADNATAFPAWTIKVTADTPIWFYCRQTGHCPAGMVGAINAPTTGANTFAAFQSLATAGNTTSSTGTTTTGSTTGSTTDGTAPSTDTPTGAVGRTSLSRAAVALAGVAGAAFLLA